MNPFDLLKQFGNIQEKMKETQERLRQIRVTGTAGGDMVQVDLNGHLEVLSVRISTEAMDPQDRSLLEDLVRAAFSDALTKAKDRIREEMVSIGGGLDLPPGLMGL
jgi:hypothetical protein